MDTIMNLDEDKCTGWTMGQNKLGVRKCDFFISVETAQDDLANFFFFILESVINMI